MIKIIFVVVGVYREENIGAVARAMKTMGIENLRLVNPKCNHTCSKALTTAHGSRDILKKAPVFYNFEESIKDLDLIIGTTAKKRSVHEDYHWVEDLPSIILNKKDSIKNVGIIFGREESGLTNHELSMCHLVSTIPMHSKYPSLNLGQAAMVYATYLSKITLNCKKYSGKKIQDVELPVVREKAGQILKDVGVDPKGIIYPRLMERLMLLKKDDINLFHTFCKHYLKKYHGRLK